MADRARRVRRHVSDDISDSSDASGPDSAELDYDPGRADPIRRPGRDRLVAHPSIAKKPALTSNPTAGSKSLKLKITPSKLREVVRASEADSLRDTLGGGQVVNGPRNRRSAASQRTSARAAGSRPKYREFGESDIDDEEDEGDESDDGDDDPVHAQHDASDDGEDEGDDDDADADDDVEMQDAPALPRPVKVTLKPPTKAAKPTKPSRKSSSADVRPLKSVEDHVMHDEDDEDDEDDDEDDDDESGNGDDEEDSTALALNEDAAAEEVELDDDAPGEDERSDEEDQGDEDDDEENDDDDDDDDDDDNDGSSTPMSGAATPDPAKMTKRQRGQESEHLISLDMGPQQRKFFTDAEKAMKKDEHARKRKELTKRKIQEEKAAALNRLLKPQAGKSRGAAPKPETLANLERTHEASMADDDEPMEKPSPLYTRRINNAKGVRLAVPEEWEAKYVGEVLYAPVYHGPPLPPPTNRLVQELD